MVSLRKNTVIAFHFPDQPAINIPELTLLLLVAVFLYYLGVQQDMFGFLFGFYLDVRFILGLGSAHSEHIDDDDDDDVTPQATVLCDRTINAQAR